MSDGHRSGRLATYIATAMNRARQAIVMRPDALVDRMISQLIARLTQAKTFAFRGIAPLARHCRTGGPNRGWARSHASKRGEECVKHALPR